MEAERMLSPLPAVLWPEAQDAAILPLDGVGLLHQFLHIVCFGVEEAT